MHPLHTVGAMHSDDTEIKIMAREKIYLEFKSPSDNSFISPPALLGERDCNELNTTPCLLLPLCQGAQDAGTSSQFSSPALVKFWTIYAILHLRALERQHSSWGMDVTECFYSTPEKKAPCFWHIGKCTARECWRRRCHPSLTSVCFHLSTTVLIDKTSFPDVITSRAHMLTSLRHHRWLPA